MFEEWFKEQYPLHDPADQEDCDHKKTAATAWKAAVEAERERMRKILVKYISHRENIPIGEVEDMVNSLDIPY